MTYINSDNVSSVMNNEDGTPIIAKDGNNEDYHLGQISSNYGWAQSDCGYERYKSELDRLFPEANGNFEFTYIKK